MDRSLTTLLRSLQTSTGPEDVSRLLPTATSLLTKLSNSLNVTLLSSQILENDLLYPSTTDVSKARQIFSVFYTALLRFHEDQHNKNLQIVRSNLSEDEWVRAVVKGAGDRSPRWRHTLMIGGLLLASHAEADNTLRFSLHQKLENALITAVNLSLAQTQDPPINRLSVVFVLVHTFRLLSPVHQAQLDYDLLLPILTDATFRSKEGLDHGYWISTIDQDIRQIDAQRFSWSVRSPSFMKLQDIKSKPFVSGLGGLSNLLAHSIENVRDRRSILQAMDQVADFSRSLMMSWRQNKLSEIDVAEEAQCLDQDTLRRTLPVLLQVLRDSMFAIIIVLRAVLGRLLSDDILAADVNATTLTTQSLHILRNTYFISHRFGQTSSSQYVFVNFSCIDILNQYPQRAESFLTMIRPSNTGQTPRHPLDRILDLFFLNTAEHFTISVSAATNEELVKIAMPYIQMREEPRFNELVEAGHSLVLAVFAAPQNASIVPRRVPLYVETLMHSFPQILNPRQFRLAIKSVIRLAAPPSPVSAMMPYMQATVLDMLSQRLVHSSEALLPRKGDMAIDTIQPLSEKSVLFLSIVDCLSFLPAPLLEELLPTTADLLYKVENPEQRDLCQRRFWEVLSNGDMDVERAALCVLWWNSRGGRESVLFGERPEEDDFTMSGGILAESRI